MPAGPAPPPARASAVSRAKASCSSWSALKPLARRIALRSHCSPKTSSSAPTTRRRAEIGTSVSAGPSAAVAAARTAVAAPTPSRDERQPRVIPAASTIVSASTISTALARKAERTRKTALTSPELGGASETALAARAVMIVPRQGRRERPYQSDTGATEDAASGRAARSGRHKGVSLAPPSLGLRVPGEATEVDADARLVADHPGVVPGRDCDDVAGAALALAAVVHLDVHPAGDAVEEVGRLAAVCASDRLHVLRPAPARLE